MEKHARTLLVVAADEEDRDQYGEWLEDDGFDVLICSGPSRPGYTCVGARRGTCALAHGADLVVLDTSLPGDDLHEGTSATDLVTLYTSLGKPVVALTALKREVPAPADWLRWSPSREELITAARGRLLQKVDTQGRSVAG
jgi:CheY-like chemotaxis protein